MEAINALPSAKKYTLFLKGLIYILAALYLLNCFSPLRLHVDSLRYFAIKDCIESGCPPGSAAASDYLPYGYTALLLALSKIGLLKSFTIIFINCFFLVGGLYMTKKIFGSTVHSLFFPLLVLLNWTVIKFVTHPLSEMQYLFFSTASLYFFYRYSKNKTLLSLVWAFVFAAIAFVTRTVGVALVAALVTGLIWQYRKELILLARKNKIMVSLILVVFAGVIIFSKQLGLNHYTGVMTKQFNEGRTFGGMLKWHFTEWAEIGFNTSSVKILPHLPSSAGPLLFVLAGILFFAGFVYLLFFRKNNIPFIIKSYLFFYFIMMFNWPFYDPRFWVPVLPLMAGTLTQVSFYEKGKHKWVPGFLFSIYALIGIASIGYLTYTSLNREKLARTQANGVYRNEYETIFFGKPQSDTAKKTDSVILDVLRRYNK